MPPPLPKWRIALRSPPELGTLPHHEVNDLADVPQHIVKEIKYFLQIYKEPEGIKTVVGGWRGREFAAEVLDASRLLARSPVGPE